MSRSLSSLLVLFVALALAVPLQAATITCTWAQRTFVTAGWGGDWTLLAGQTGGGIFGEFAPTGTNNWVATAQAGMTINQGGFSGTWFIRNQFVGGGLVDVRGVLIYAQGNQVVQLRSNQINGV